MYGDRAKQHRTQKCSASAGQRLAFGVARPGAMAAPGRRQEIHGDCRSAETINGDSAEIVGGGCTLAAGAAVGFRTQNAACPSNIEHRGWTPSGRTKLSNLPWPVNGCFVVRRGGSETPHHQPGDERFATTVRPEECSASEISARLADGDNRPRILAAANAGAGEHRKSPADAGFGMGESG